MMKRFFASILASVLVLLSFTSIAHAQPFTAVSPFVLAVATVEADVMEQLKTDILPQIQKVLTPEQQEQLETAIVEGKTSLRKAFKALSLTPEQKTQLAAVFKSLPKKEIFTAMTPEQKREFFMKKKEIFMPTPEEIAGYKAKKAQSTP